MRVYELAKAAGVTSADVLRAAEGCGAEVTNAISVIEAGELAALQAAVKGLAKGDLAAKRAAKQAKAAAARQAATAAEAEKLKHHLALAKAASEGLKVETAVAPKAVASAAPKKAVPPPETPAAPVKLGPISINPRKPQQPAKPKPAISISVAPAQPAAAQPAAPAAPARPAIRMAPGYKPKVAVKPALQAGPVKVGLTAAGFKPLPHAPAGSGAIRITVAAQPKVPLEETEPTTYFTPRALEPSMAQAVCCSSPSLE